MPASLIGVLSVLGLADIVIQKVEQSQGGLLWAKSATLTSACFETCVADVCEQLDYPGDARVDRDPGGKGQDCAGSHQRARWPQVCMVSPRFSSKCTALGCMQAIEEDVQVQ